jgi:hypothetical protein
VSHAQTQTQTQSAFGPNFGATLSAWRRANSSCFLSDVGQGLPSPTLLHHYSDGGEPHPHVCQHFSIRRHVRSRRRCHPQEALYLPTFSHLLIVNTLLSLSLSLSLTPSPCSTSYSLLPLEATRASVHDVKTERARSHNKRDNTSTQYMLYITQYMFCQSVRLRWSRASRDTSCACTTHRPFVFCYGFPRASLSPSLSLSLSICLSLSAAQKLRACAW